MRLYEYFQAETEKVDRELRAQRSETLAWRHGVLSDLMLCTDPGLVEFKLGPGRSLRGVPC